jgi:hypothetical protein
VANNQNPDFAKYRIKQNAKPYLVAAIISRAVKGGFNYWPQMNTDGH